MLNPNVSEEDIKARYSSGQKRSSSGQRSFFLPELDDLLTLITLTVDSGSHPNIHFLDTGPGRGVMCERMLDRHPSSKSTLIYDSDVLLPKPLAQHKPSRLSICEALHALPPSTQFDIVTSCYGIIDHQGIERYSDFYSHIHPIIRPNGHFCFCDMVDTPGWVWDEHTKHVWEKHLESLFSEQDIHTLLQNANKPKSLISMATHMELLFNAGFQYIDILWKKQNVVVFNATA